MASPSVSDVRSPKRQAACSASRVIVALDAAIWTSIIEFLPVRAESAEEAAKEASATLQTLLNLRLVSQNLAQLLHPTKSKVLWQRLLLRTFDFSTSDDYWNVTNENDLGGECGEYDPATDDPADPQVVALEGRWQIIPDELLDEGLVKWHTLGVYYRRSQYGFLSMLQQDPPTGLWPLNEDPFSLFHDLIQLLRLPDGETMIAYGEACEPMDKCLVAPASDSDPSAPFYRYHVMQTLGYAPHFWHAGSGIGGMWMEFREPNAFANAIERELIDYAAEDAYYEGEFDMDFEHDVEFAFQRCCIGHAKQLFQCITQSYRDWRSVCCNSGSDGLTPLFFVGKSKIKPYRWTGYFGTKAWS